MESKIHAPLVATKQEIEKYQFNLFRLHYDIPCGEVEFSDRPDVIIRGEKNIGVEIARLHKVRGKGYKSEKAQIFLRTKVIEEAERIYKEKGGRSVEFWIDFEPEVKLFDVQLSAKKLAEAALLVADEYVGYKGWRSFKELPEIRCIMHNGREYYDAKWRSAQVYDVPGLIVERVKEEVALKSLKIKDYQHCDVYWLLFVVDFWDPAQDQYIDWPGNECLSKTPFEKILIYRTHFSQVTEVPQDCN